MKLISTLFLITILAYAKARPTFDRIADVLLGAVLDDHSRPSSPYAYGSVGAPHHHGGYVEEGYHYHYGGGGGANEIVGVGGAYQPPVKHNHGGYHQNIHYGGGGTPNYYPATGPVYPPVRLHGSNFNGYQSPPYAVGGQYSQGGGYEYETAGGSHGYKKHGY